MEFFGESPHYTIHVGLKFSILLNQAQKVLDSGIHHYAQGIAVLIVVSDYSCQCYRNITSFIF